MTDRQDAVPPNPVEPIRAGGSGDHIDDDLCTDIVAGLVPRDELRRVFAHLDACPECENRLMVVAGDWELIRSRADGAGWIGVSGTGASSNAGPRRPGVPVLRQPRFLLPLALAAGILILILARLPQPARHSEDLSYWMPVTGELLQLRGANSGEADSAFWTGLDAYQEHDIPKAAALLQDSRAAGGLDDLRRLHLASLLVNTDRAAATLALLNQLEMNSLPMPWRDEAYWMEYLALVRLRRTGEAAVRLEKMAEWPGRIGDLARERKERSRR